MAWHPMPPPTSVPGATLVLVLCGQPLQKNGARSTERAITTSADRRGQRRQALVEACREARPQRRDQSLGVEDPAGGDQRAALVVAPTDDAWTLVPVVERVGTRGARGRLLLDDDDLGEAVGELATCDGSSGTGINTWNRRIPAADRVVVGETEQLEASRHPRSTSCCAAMPIQSSSLRTVTPVESVEHAVLAGQFERTSKNSRSMSSACRASSATVRVRHERPAVEEHRRNLGDDSVGMDVDGPGAVGHLADELDARPQSTRTRQGDGVAAQVERLLHVAGKKIGMWRSTIVARSTTATSTTWRPDRRRRALRRRRARTSRRTHRGGWRRSPGRAQVPWRTTATITPS